MRARNRATIQQVLILKKFASRTVKLASLSKNGPLLRLISVPLVVLYSFRCIPPGGTPYNGLYGEAPSERGTFFKLQVYERVGISLVEVY